MTNSELDQRLNAVVDKCINRSNLNSHNQQKNKVHAQQPAPIYSYKQHATYYLNQNTAFDDFMLNWGIGLSTALIMLITSIVSLFL